MAITTKKPTKFRILLLRLMIWCGLGAMTYFLFSYFTSFRGGSLGLYVLVTFSIMYKLLRVVVEWYYLFHIKYPEPKPLPTSNDISVDMFTTYYPGEPKAMVMNTLLAMKAVTFPHETVLCCEGHDAELEVFCKKHNIRFIFRNDRTNAKAGNINNALIQTKGDLCVILDPDHEPFPDFLDNVVGQFEDDKVGFVQVVQAYKNQEESPIAKGAAEQTYFFYGPMMSGMHGQSTAQAIGANCTFRRKALESIGGHAPGLTEDMHTSMLLHAKGWKSVYVPQITAKGLVPASFSSFIKQQLKWSRGSFDLLFNVYPKCFNQLNFRQKWYYFTICLYFLVGLVVLLDFLVPVLSLFTSSYPIVTNFRSFVLSIFPLTLSIFAIRVYAKKWLYEPHEKRLFWRGGFLVIASWFAYLLGFIYAILRKKVPYIPTVKEEEQTNEWKIHFPNLIFIGLFIVAIIFGLRRDFTPFSLTMAGFAGFNMLVLIWALWASQGKVLNVFKNKLFRIIKHFVSSLNGLVVRVLMPFSFLICLIGIVWSIDAWNSKINPDPYVFEKVDYNFRDRGIPEGPRMVGFYDNVSDVHLNNAMNYDLASFYVGWGASDTLFPIDEIQRTAQQGKIPVITWEPWSSGFEWDNPSDSMLYYEQGVFKAITEGTFDTYLDEFIAQLKTIKQPVFLRYAHEMGNPQYPWSSNSVVDYIDAWRYVHTYFQKKNANHVIWVWNPWEDELQYYPGSEYVDWVGYTLLDYSLPSMSKYHKFEFIELYERRVYTNQKLKKPVMLAEFGSARTGAEKQRWLNDAFRAMDLYYPEIQAVVFFQSDEDAYVPKYLQSNTPEKVVREIDWKVEKSALEIMMQDFIRERAGGKMQFSLGEQFIGLTYDGLNYNPDDYWRVGNRPLTRKQLEYDFQLIKTTNVLKDFPAILRNKVDLYSYNVLQIAAEYELKVDQGFDFPAEFDYSDAHKMDSLRTRVVQCVKELKDHTALNRWILSTDLADDFRYFYAMPHARQMAGNYKTFIEQLSKEIEQTDPNHEVLLADLKGVPNYSTSFIGHKQVSGFVDFKGRPIASMIDAGMNEVTIQNDNQPYFEGVTYEFELVCPESPLTDQSEVEWELFDDGVFKLMETSGKKVLITLPSSLRGNVILKASLVEENGIVRVAHRTLELR